MHKALIYYYHYIALKSLNITFKKTSLFSKLIPIVLIIKKIIIINDFLIHFFKGSTGECELAVVSSPPVSRKPHYAKEVSSDQLLNLRYIHCLHILFVYIFYFFTYFICLHFQRSVRSWQSLSRSATHSRGTITSSSFATNLGFCS